MLRAIWLTIQNETRLLIKDPIVLFMLLFAPVVIITVAGYSLGTLYGGVGSSIQLPVVNHDQGEVADGIIDALRKQGSINVELLEDSEQARALVSHRDRTPVALEIPAGTTEAVKAGRNPNLVVFVDPVRRIEADAVELRLAELTRQVSEQTRTETQKRLDDADATLRVDLRHLADQIADEQAYGRTAAAKAQKEIEASIRTQIDAAVEQTTKQTEATVKERQTQVWSDLYRQLEPRRPIVMRIESYLVQLQATQRAFEDWLAKLKVLAGSHAADIPPPPSLPPPPSQADLAELAKPLVQPKIDTTLPTPSPEAFAITIPKLPALRDANLADQLNRFESSRTPTVPGGLGIVELPAVAGGPTVVNAFDQYVPGFGITFLLIGMMLGIALTLFDERDWGTLRRLRVSGAPLAGLLLGKLIARFVVGIVQMVVLFAFGWALFGITLGPNPLALLVPTAGISFASAALGLVIASISSAHDSVMPLGVTLSMAIAAIGGCWWPLDFEPGWMRMVARFVPTTWTMQSFNDLMIRNRPLSATLWPFLATFGLGAVFLIVGLLRFATLED